MTWTMKRFAKASMWTFGLGAIAAISGALGVGAVTWAMVMFGDDSHLNESTVKARIVEETTIYMNDDQTQIGSFFASGHRRYVPIDEVPAHMINAIIAAEDKNFYNHIGVDPQAIGSAVFSAFTSGRLRGASGLTQQTVKNIMGDWEFSFRRKFREAIASFQLERLYSKRQILEFYLNQFYVSGNGNGIGIAARYYFNKDVRDLDLVESAFIAGSVKGPSAYDPFIKFTKDKRELAIRRAFNRKNYVLKRMFEQGWINEEEFKEAYDRPVKFKRGRFRTTEVALIQLIRTQLKRQEILEELNIENVQQLNQAGLKIFTTIDPDLQERAQLAMRRNLSRLDTILKGYKPERPERFKKLRSLIPNDFYYAKVVEMGGTEKEPEIKVTFGLPEGVIKYDSLMRYAKLLDLPYGRGWKKQLKDLKKDIKPGDILFVEVTEYDPETHEAVVEIKKRPRVNGGMLVLDKGEVRAVVSGFDTKGYNRAISARRQPGSVFKPLVFFGGLQLGWNILDKLDNERRVFPYQGQFYFPRGDHVSPYRKTSVLWAGIMSENLASVYLANHLLKKVNFSQFKQLMEFMGLAPESGESERDYHYRIARDIGVQLDNAGVKEYQLNNAIDDVILDVQYTATAAFQSKINKMWWGRGYANEMKAICLIDPDEISNKRKAMRWNLLKNNFLRHEALHAQVEEDWKTIQAKVEEIGPEATFQDPSIQHVINRFRKVSGHNKPVLGYFATLPSEEMDNCKDTFNIEKQMDLILVKENRNPVPLSQLDIQAIWGGNSMFGADLSLTDVKLEGWLSYGEFVRLRNYVDEHFAEVNARSGEYDLHRYYQHHDFRIGLGLKYLVAMTKAMGVTSKLEPVQSYPLGTNEVTVAEVAKIYQTLISGKTYRFYEEGPPNQMNFVKRIEDRFGNTLFEPERKEFQLVEKAFALQMREILRRIVTHGTGRRARGELFLDLAEKIGLDPSKPAPKKQKSKLVRIPAFGKTGTTNDYTNAYFAGWIPYPTEKNAPLDPDNAYVISAYVGYDLNKTMRAGYLRISGAQGALPAWIGLAQAAIETKKYSEMLDDLDLNIIAKKEWPLKYDETTSPLFVDLSRGTVLNRSGGDESYSLTNLATTGESRFNEHAAHSIKGSVHIPTDSGALFRRFAPFKFEEEEEGEDIEPSRITGPEENLSIPQPSIAVSEGTKPANGTQPLQQNPQIPSPNAIDDSAASQPDKPKPPKKPAPKDPEEDLFGDLLDEEKAPTENPNAKDDADDETGFIEEELW